MARPFCVVVRSARLPPPATLTQDGLIGQAAIDHQLSPLFDFEFGMILSGPVLSQHVGCP